MKSIKSYLNDMATPQELLIYNNLERTNVNSVYNLERSLSMERNRIIKVVQLSPLMTYDKKSGYVSKHKNDTPLDEILVEGITKNSELVLSRLCECDYSYSMYLTEYGDYKNKQYGFDTTPFKCMTRGSFKVTRSQLKRKYYFIVK